VNDIDISAIAPWLQIMWDQKGSDLLLAGDSAPRVRVDGKLRPVEGAPVLTGAQIDTLVRTLLNPSQQATFEVEQDVDFSFSWLDRARLRGSAFTQRGETALALRMIPSKIPTFAELDLPPTAEWLANLPRGFVLVTGPTGSGKSTTLYAALNALNDGERSILTIEDPVEKRIPGIKQMQIAPKAGVTFDVGLRSMLRADPDVIMVGEIRDRETAHIAVEAALTGHLVLSTLHTRDAPSALGRLIDMGIEPFLVSSAVDCIVAQRLVRMLCKHCKRLQKVSKAVLAEQ
jgi:pilus retraction protein PilT